MCGVGSLSQKSECMSSKSNSDRSGTSTPTNNNNNCSETVDHHFSEESKKMNGGGSSEKSEDGGGSTGTPPSPAGRGSGSGSASPTGGCPSCRQLLCSCGKSPSSAGLLNYQRLASTVPSLVYPPNPSNPNASPYSPDQVAYLAAAAAAAAEHSALYAVAGGGLPDMKEGGLGPAGWAYPSMYHPYDPGFAAAAAAAAAAYPFNGYSMDMNGSRRKNATRETTSTLKAWLAEHRKNPYPTKGEKIMLAIITKMTLTQVSTWFANARRRLKKENKMTWEPRNRPDDDDDDVNISDDEDDRPVKTDRDNERLSSSTNSHHVHGKSSPTESSCSDVSKEGASSTPNQKPRIWSVADLANDTGGGGSGHSGERGEPGGIIGSHPHHPLLSHPHLLNLHQHNLHSANHHHHHSSGSSSSASSSGSGAGGAGPPPGSAAAAAAAASAAAAAFLHNHHLRNNNSHHLPHHLQQLHHHAASSNHHPASSLPGSAFSPLSRSASSHSEAIYRGLYPLPHPAAYHSSAADNP